MLIASSSMLVLADEHKVNIAIEQPALDVEPYHRPYVAVWIETPAREVIATVALWADDPEWYKDLRQWWRKVGRYGGEHIDGITGATRRPGSHKLAWSGKNDRGEPVPAGQYVLHVEASREEGGRSYGKQAFTLGESASLTIPADRELGDVNLQIR